MGHASVEQSLLHLQERRSLGLLASQIRRLSRVVLYVEEQWRQARHVH